ncbi:ribosome quality control complex subunit NEMF-like [Zophobas morio]|uniref:ribosome quality control complex subunit NEMF-like n=1 Tax=Zophobas morio TaxID=2755281 RepID=UPI003082E545
MKTCLSPQKSVSSICSSRDYKNILDALNFAREVIYNTSFKGFIIQKKEGRTDVEGRTSIFFVNEEYHPLLFKQHETLPYKEFDTFNLAVDEFYSNLEAQRIDIIALQHEKQALKKLENLRIDHEKRLSGLASEQLNDIRCAQLIEANLELVDRAIAAVLELLASQFSWDQIHVS